MFLKVISVTPISSFCRGKIEDGAGGGTYCLPRVPESTRDVGPEEQVFELVFHGVVRMILRACVPSSAL